MLKRLFFCLKYFLFWILFFFAERLLFLAYFKEKISALPFREIAPAFLYGLWMDISMVGYICSIPLLGMFFSWVFPVRNSAKLLLRYTQTLVVIFSIIAIADLNIYREWGTKINFRALDFAFTVPNEAIASSASSPIFASLIALGLLISFFFWISYRAINLTNHNKINISKRIGIALILGSINFLAIRGGWQLSPINESMAYFSNKPVLNFAALNTDWQLMHDILDNAYNNKNPYAYYSTEKAKSLVRQLYPASETKPLNILSTSRPNVVIIIMESFTADVIKSLGGETGITPNMEKLISNGLLFSNIYASGDRTDKGIIAILSAFPSQATRSIIKANSKQEKLASLSQVFDKQGYQTSFYYGGESQFFNVKSYLLSHSYHKIVDEPFFDKKDMNSKWGAYDHAVYNKQLVDLEHEKQPFFSTIQTLTNHEPFELPGKAYFPGRDVGDKFRSTAYYADSTLANYLAKAQFKPWYKNTLFIIVADHGHILPKNKYEIHDPHRFHIPLLFYGGALKTEYKGKRIATLGGQTDIAATLLSQLNLGHSQFHWSKDLLNPATKEFSFYDWDNGFGMIMPGQSVSYDNVGKRAITLNPVKKSSKTDSLMRYGKAYMQTVYQHYLNY